MRSRRTSQEKGKVREGQRQDTRSGLPANEPDNRDRDGSREFWERSKEPVRGPNITLRGLLSALHVLENIEVEDVGN